MISDIQIVKPEPITPEHHIDLFDRTSNIEKTIRILVAGKFVLISSFYSNGLMLLKGLKRHLRKKISE